MRVSATKGNVIIRINDHIVELPAPFENGFQIQDKYIVLLNDRYSKSNILAFNSEGNLVWEVQENNFKHIKKGYELIYPREKDLFVANILETWYAIDANTGKIIMTYGDHQKTIYYNQSSKFNWLKKLLKIFR